MGKLMSSQQLRSILPLKFLKGPADNRQNRGLIEAIKLLVDDQFAKALDVLLKVQQAAQLFSKPVRRAGEYVCM